MKNIFSSEKEFARIKKPVDNAIDRFENGGLLAPNGKPSNLTSEQHRLVRTPEFKAWFGDWENDPANASKVVDENGEPLVVYRGMPKKRRVGNIFRYNVNLFGSGIAGRQTNKFAFYFTDNENVAERYGKNLASDEGEEFVVRPYFINIRRIFKAFSFKNDFETKFSELYDLANDTGKPVLFYDVDGELKKDFWTDEPLEWKNNTQEWRNKYENGYEQSTFAHFVDWNKNQGNQWFWRTYLEDVLKYDGLVFYETTHNMVYDDSNQHLIPEFGDEYSKTYGVFNPRQIKLADGTNTTFDAKNPDIRMGVGGKLIKRKDGHYSRHGLWDSIRENKGSGRKPTAAMLAEEEKIKNKQNKKWGLQKKNGQ